eukprot:TRINITY_DN5090_c0_g1_i1.p1 TRINITY_DN5090_c0_g1~~TRINITY_DN5090_c0_g1_i1.p1  ORF type:complete len:521 (-),score=96.30 TRINITY_DN5090_c0_g1_i1:13-1530(-)
MKKAKKLFLSGNQKIAHNDQIHALKDFRKCKKILEDLKDSDEELEELLEVIDLLKKVNRILKSDVFEGTPIKPLRMRRLQKRKRLSVHPNRKKDKEKDKDREEKDRCKSLELLPSARAMIENSMDISLQDDIHKFALEGYAEQYFRARKKKRLIFNRKIPVSELLQYTDEPITHTLLNLKEEFVEVGIECFDKILKYMMATEQNLNIPRDIIKLALSTAEIRDEIYCQLVKQTHKNPVKDAEQRVWELMCIFLHFFPPLKNLESYLEAFLIETKPRSKNIKSLVDACSIRLTEIKELTYIKTRLPTLQEIEYSLQCAFKISYFSYSFDELMEVQHDLYPSLDIPFIIYYLLEILRENNGTNQIGLFRTKGKPKLVNDLKISIDNNNVHWNGSPHIPATLLKDYLKQAHYPVIPDEFYYPLTEAEEFGEIIDIIDMLPDTNKLILEALIRFFQEMAQDGENNMVTPEYLGVLLGPVIFRCPKQDPASIIKLASLENAVITKLIENM